MNVRRLACLSLAALPLGCLAPALRPAEMADVGQVVGSVGLLFPDGQGSGVPVEGSATAAVGLLPHLQLEASGVIDSGNSGQTPPPLGSNVGADWRIGGGVRGAIPLGARYRSELQIAGLFDLGRSSRIVDSSTCSSFCSQTQFFDERRGTLEAGWVSNFEHHHGAVGLWLDGFAAFLEQSTTSSSGSCPPPVFRSDFTVGGLGARFGLDLRPFDAAPWLGFLFGASTGFPVTTPSNGQLDVRELDWFEIGAGFLFVL